MRTFPRALATFRDLVNERGRRLRQLSFEELEHLGLPPETLTVESRHATIITSIEHQHDGRLQVLLRGTMAPRFLPLGHHLAIDGFYKDPDGTVTPMLDREFHQWE